MAKEVKEMVDCPSFVGHIPVEDCKRRGSKIGCFKGMSLDKVVCEYAATDDMPVGDTDDF